MTNVETLPQTTTERLIKVADIIETNPEAYYQYSWVQLSAEEESYFRQLLEIEEGARLEYYHYDKVGLQQGLDNAGCGTTCCLAGWAVRYTPKEIDLPRDWDEAGAKALGLDSQLAEAMFQGGFGQELVDPHIHIAAMLRFLATLPEGGRTYDALAPFFDDNEHIREALDEHYDPDNWDEPCTCEVCV